MPYNVNPSPLSGEGVWGKVPGLTDLPSPSTDLAAQIPGLAGTNKAAIADINAKLGGSISPGTMNALQNAAATFGLTSGMPGLRPGSLGMNNLFGNIVGFAENQAQQGLQDYNQFVPTVSSTQTVSPALQAQIATSNAVNRAAPNPSAAGSHAEQLFNKYLNALRGGPGGGTRPGAGGGGGPSGGGRDLLGFPTPGGGSTAEPGIFVGQSRSGGWGLGNAATPIGSGTSGAMSGFTDETGAPLGTLDLGDSSVYNPLAGYGNFFGAGGTAGGGTPGSGTFYAGANPADSSGLTDEEWAAITGG